MKKFLFLLVIGILGCGPVKPPVPPPTPPPSLFCIAPTVTSSQGGPVAGADIWVEGLSGVTNQDGYVYIDKVPASLSTTVSVSAPGYNVYIGNYAIDSLNCDLPVTLVKAIPPPLTRDQALGAHMSFQGLICHTTEYGDMPWFPAALSWLDLPTRNEIYPCLKNAGDTEVIIQIPNGLPLYNETDQFYSPDKFPALDWTAGETSMGPQFADLVVEVREQGFIPLIDMDERQDHSIVILPLVLNALLHSSYGDLSHQVGPILPGYDGVFYGWSNPQTTIPAWATLARSIVPDVVLGAEFNTGHIFQEGGIDMSGFDAIFIEFEQSVHTWNNWQIVSRLIGEDKYVKPADDNSPHPVPMMNMTTPRGPIQTVCFEYKTYWFVRGENTPADVAADRSYLYAEGCPIVD